MINSENIDTLSVNNYVRKATHHRNYWFDFSKSQVDLYLSRSKNFNIIIYSEFNNPGNYYVIPYLTLRKALKAKYQSKAKKGERERWVGNIINHQIKIGRYPERIDLSEYFIAPLDILTLLLSVQEDIESFDSEASAKFEGGRKSKMVNYYERNAKLRADAIKIHGTRCKVCQFDFKQIYGAHGENYIEVHHLKQLSSLIDVTLVDPFTDMTVLCSNCHRMIHRQKDNPLSIESLIELLEKAKSQA